MRAVYLISLLLLAASQTAQQPQVTGPTGTAVVEGIVRDAVTHNPIEGVKIGIVPFRGGISYSSLRDSKLFTDADGRFTVRNLSPDEYMVIAGKTGYFSRESVRLRPNIEREPTIAIAAQQRMENLVIELIPASVISGRVLGPDGVPVVGAYVGAIEVSYDRRDGHRLFNVEATSGEDYSGASLRKFAVTDDRGEYRIIWLKPGVYYVGVENFVHLGKRSTVYFPGTPDPAAARQVRANAGLESGAIDISVPKLASDPTFTVSGNLVGLPSAAAGSPIRQIYFVSRGEKSTESESVSVPNMAGDSTSGRFQVRGIPAGEYQIVVDVRDSEGRAAAARTSIQVVDTDLVNVMIPVQPGVELKGRILLNDAVLSGPRTGIPQNARTLLKSLDGLPDAIYRTGSLNSPIDPKTGEFSISNLPAGRYNFDPGLPWDAYLFDVKQGGRSILAEGITISSSAPVPVDFLFRSPPGIVDGIVRDARLNAVVGAEVLLVSEATSASRSVTYFTVRTGRDGKFSIRVAPGEYKAFAWIDLPAASPWLNSDFMKPFEQRKQMLIAVEGSTPNIQLIVIPDENR